jgi:hypothetical protein
MKALLAIALLMVAGCKKPTQQQYLQLVALPPPGGPDFRTTTAPDHFKEDFVVWKKVPIRVRWSSAMDEGNCRRILAADVSRTGGPVEYVVSAPHEAIGTGPAAQKIDLDQQWLVRAPCASGIESMHVRLTAKHGRDDMVADFTIDGAGALAGPGPAN